MTYEDWALQIKEQVFIQYGNNGIVVRVEGKDDVPVWKTILTETLNEQFFVEIFPYSDAPSANSTGKKNVLAYVPYVNNRFLLCVDADYDYVNQDAVISNNPYVIHTYCYSIENIICQPHNLSKALQVAANEINTDVDFDKILLDYSKLIYNLLVFSIQNKTLISAENAGKQVLITQHFENLAQEFERLNLEVNIFLTTQNIDNESFILFKSNLLQLNFGNTNAYLFLRGHDLYASCIHLLNHFQQYIRGQKKETINDETTKRNYFEGLKNTQTALVENWTIGDFPFLENIKNDIRVALN
jgi:hypothetical protein